MPTVAPKLVNLEEDHPTVNVGLLRLDKALTSARFEKVKLIKLIHGYGSSGVGGGIRLAVGRTLQQMRRDGQLTCVIYGEHWGISDPDAWSLIKQHPSLKKEEDLGRKNRGITIVWF